MSTMVCLISTMSVLFGQDQPYQSKINLTPNVGVTLPFSKFLRGDVTDHLVGYSNSTIYWQNISGAFYFTKRFGVQLDVQLGLANNGNSNEERFKKSVHESFGTENYDVMQGSHIMLPVKTDIYTGMTLGAVYRFESGRWYCNPKLAVGFLFVSSQSAVMYLKEKDSNNVLRVRYDPNRDEFRSMNIIAGVSTGYKLAPRLYLNLDLMVNGFDSSLEFNRTSVNLIDGATTTDVISYRRNPVNLNAAVGVIIVLQKFKEFREP